MMNKIPSGKSSHIDNTTNNQTIEQPQEKRVRFKEREVTTPLTCSALLIRGLSVIRDFVVRSIYSRSIKAYNEALKETRLATNQDQIESDALFDKAWYVKLRNRMNEAQFDKTLLKDKNSSQVHAILLEHEIITPKESKFLKRNDVDLEGSPYW